MAHETLSHQERILQDPDMTVGKLVVKGTQIPVEMILAKLAITLDVEELFQDYP